MSAFQGEAIGGGIKERQGVIAGAGLGKDFLEFPASELRPDQAPAVY